MQQRCTADKMGIFTLTLQSLAEGCAMISFLQFRESNTGTAVTYCEHQQSNLELPGLSSLYVTGIKQ